MDKQIRLKVLGITYSQIQSGAYALVLAQEGGSRRIPIIIGTSEAQAIAIKLEHLTPPRPLTHDLMVGILHTFGIELKGVFIYRFEEGVFSSELVMTGPDGVERRVDSRTSDAIALALRVDAEIYTTQDIVDRAGVEFEPEQEAAAAMHEPEQSIVEELRMQIAEAQAKLDKAIADEAYEEASHIRDNIKVLQMRLEAALHPGADDAKTE